MPGEDNNSHSPRQRQAILDDTFHKDRQNPKEFLETLHGRPADLEVLSINNNVFHESSYNAVLKLLDSRPTPAPSTSFPPLVLERKSLTEEEQRCFGGLLRELVSSISRFTSLRVLRMAGVYNNVMDGNDASHFFPIETLLRSLPVFLEELDLQGTAFDTQDLAVDLPKNLKILKLSHAHIDKGKKLAQFLKGTQIEEFTFKHSQNAADFFVEFLSELANPEESNIVSSLVSLDISENEIGSLDDNEWPYYGWLPPVFQQIVIFFNLESLNVSNNALNGEAIESFIHHLATRNGLPNLKRISFIEGNEISNIQENNAMDEYGVYASGHELQWGMEDEIPTQLPSQLEKILQSIREIGATRVHPIETDWR